MKRLWLLCMVSVLVSCAAPATKTLSRDQELVDLALAAMGGADALRGQRGVSIKGTVKYWEPEQSHTPGGEMRFAADARFDAVHDFANHVSRIDWEKKFAYPTPRTFTYAEIVTPGAGVVIGIDSNGRTRMAMSQRYELNGRTVTDIWSPGAAPLPKEISTPLAAIVNAARRAGIQPLRFAGGHGSTGDYAPLGGLAGQK